jgi:tetratricopeptide (TPR) repeat protein
MARAAVKAKQQAKAKVGTAKPTRARGRRRHSGGGNPNQDLFFVKLRRGQKWLYALLAIVFALTFAGVGVGSGASGGLSQLWTGLFGGSGGGSVSKAQAEVKKDPAKGYRALATAYETNGNDLLAMNALQSYLSLKKKDANAWSELGGLELSQGGTYAKQYQSAQQAAQTADPSAPFQPGGPLASALGSNAAYQGAAQTATTRTSVLYQKATTSFSAAVSDYRNAANLQPHSSAAQEELATAAENAGNIPVAIAALTKFRRLAPHSPLLPQINAQLKALIKAQHSAPTPPPTSP